jgi:hypothetical protein
MTKLSSFAEIAKISSLGSGFHQAEFSGHKSRRARSIGGVLAFYSNQSKLLFL